MRCGTVLLAGLHNSGLPISYLQLLGGANYGTYNQGVFNTGNYDIGFFNSCNDLVGIGLTGDHKIGIGPFYINE
ncbi:MAG: hypothetical protein JO236_18585 [Mycobacterium sp.]|uniref:hypothetical protein n=1 Tax=Mycobacterium sp. TaxID=1785 RepID=UPI001ED7BF42|nr:hypothetical protein [Mycobacterium sp.]MBW0019537.1 hypothetical protein [Mycobacterium sp.]